MDSSKKQRRFYLIQFILGVVQLLTSLIEGSALPLSRDELRAKYGQGTFQVKEHFTHNKRMKKKIFFTSRDNF